MKLSDKLQEYSSYTVVRNVLTPPPSGQGDMDMAVSRLRVAAEEFAQLTLDQRIALARSLQQGYLRVAERSVEAGCRAKGIAAGTPAEAEEWATGPWGIVRQLRLVIESLTALRKCGNTTVGKTKRNASGNLSVNVFPGNAVDALLFKDVTVDVHMLPQVTETSLAEDRARFYKNPDHRGIVALVLGAGNIAAIGVMDVITKMFNEGKVCLLKMNPVNAYLGPYIEEAFKQAIDKHYLALIYGGVEEGRHLVYHPDIDEVHLTGSDKTYDQIVWGAPGSERQSRIQTHEPLMQKPISAELGNVSPVIIVPGPYTGKDIAFQAEAIASAMTMNASFFCNSAKVLVSPREWAGSNHFLQAIQDVCRKIEPRQAYYPGAHDRWQSLTQGRSNVTHIGNPKSGALPWSFITGLDPDDDNERLFREETFCPVFAETRLAGADPVQFLERAVEFCNNRLWGTLNATLIVHPKTLQAPAVNAAFERAICNLRYGTVAVNTFPGISFVFASSPWGAYPGAALEDIQSGSGFVHNTPMLEGIEKAVIRAPLTVFPKPAFLPSHKTEQTVMRRIVAMEENASWVKVPGIVWAAMRG